MPKKNSGYIWTPGGKPPPLEAHSLAKHKVFASYLKRYVQVLAQNPRVSKLPITFIDGFSGGGIYCDELNSSILHEGSPLLLLTAIKESEVLVNQLRQSNRIRTTFNVNAEFHFVDIKETNVQTLNQELTQRGYASRIGQDIYLHSADFNQIYNELISKIKGRNRNGRCIFLLDQYGYDDISMPVIQTIFSQLYNAEVILTFATDYIADYLSEKTGEMFKQKFEEIGLSSEIIPQILTSGQNSYSFRQVVQSSLIQPLHTASTAKYFTPFFIVSQESNKAYWLIHLSMHPKARDVMLQEHWGHHNTFEHYGRPGLKMLGYSPKQDLEYGNSQPLPFKFEETAKTRTQSSLSSELPERIRGYENGVRVSDFLAKIANETPAHNDLILEVLTQLSSSKSIEVDSPDGKKRRSGSIVKTNDIMYPSRQVIIDFGR